jgi:hypothetical protein
MQSYGIPSVFVLSYIADAGKGSLRCPGEGKAAVVRFYKDPHTEGGKGTSISILTKYCEMSAPVEETKS